MHELDVKKKEVEDKDIREKAKRVARYLGFQCDIDDNRGNKIGKEYTLSAHDIQIDYRAGYQMGDFSGLEIIYRKEWVFYQGGGKLYCYIPGHWENILDELSIMASAVEESQK